MSDALAIAGTFADFKLVKTRGMAQFVVEVPIDQADKALALLGGVPRADKEVWVAVAPLVPEAVKAASVSPKSEAASERAKANFAALPDMKKDVVKAALLIKDRTFQTWILWPARYSSTPDWIEAANAAMKKRLFIDSKAEIGEDEDANERFHVMITTYLADTNQMAEVRS